MGAELPLALSLIPLSSGKGAKRGRNIQELRVLYLLPLLIADGRLRRHHRRRHEDRARRWSPSRELGEEPPTLVADNGVFVGDGNATVIRAHVGSTAVLDCRVRKNSQYGMVSGVYVRKDLSVQRFPRSGCTQVS